MGFLSNQAHADWNNCIQRAKEDTVYQITPLKITTKQMTASQPVKASRIVIRVT